VIFGGHRFGVVIVFCIMSRIYKAAMVLLFMLGMLVVPVMHKVELACDAGVCSSCTHQHDDDTKKHGGHDSGNCPICQMMDLPLDVASVAVVIVSTAVRVVDHSFVEILPVMRLPRMAYASRAPPLNRSII